MTSVSGRTFETLSEIDGRYWATVFFAGIFGYVLLQVLTALGYSPPARLFPILVGVPVLVMTAVKVLQLLAGDRLGIQVTDLFEDVGQMEFEESETVTPAVRYRREFSMFLWTFALITLIWVIGILPALAVFVFVFIYAHERNLARAVAAMLVTYGFVYLLFIQLLGAVLYEGLVTIRIAGVTIG